MIEINCTWPGEQIFLKQRQRNVYHASILVDIALPLLWCDRKTTRRASQRMLSHQRL